MTDKKQRSYNLERKVIDWIDGFADQENARKSEVVNRAVKVYAAKVGNGEWSDPKWSDQYDTELRRPGK